MIADDFIKGTALEGIDRPDEPKPDKERVGCLIFKSANQWIREAAQRPDPRQLFKSLWFENELCILFASMNAGKSILAVQIARELAKNNKVVYFDFELSDKQFQRRCSSDDNSDLSVFSENFIRAEMDISSIDIELDSVDEALINNIKEGAIMHEADALIIDNISAMCPDTQKAEKAAYLVRHLKKIVRELNISILLLAHTPKRNQITPITWNDLAGSAQLANLCDSAFAIGYSKKGEEMRYLKQIKVRNDKKRFGEDNVICYRLEKVDNFLQFVEIGYSNEKEHLIDPDDKFAISQEIMNLKKQGLSVREIANQTGRSKSAVSRIVKQPDVSQCPTVEDGTGGTGRTGGTNGTNGTVEGASLFS